VTKEVREFTNDSAVGLVDADQGAAGFCHMGLNNTFGILFPLI
jgi:hypothetical protein